MTQDLRARSYIEQNLMSKTPAELVLVAYDLGIKGCMRQDRALVRDVLTELIAALDFNVELSGRLLVLYDFALREVRENRFEQPQRILGGLRETWKQLLEIERQNQSEGAGVTVRAAA